MKSILFNCDLPKCRKKVGKLVEESFPYQKGWVYAYKLEFKVTNNKFIKDRDKHFCCAEHLLEFIKLKLEENKKVKK